MRYSNSFEVYQEPFKMKGPDIKAINQEFKTFKVYILRELWEYLLQDAYNELRSPQFQICRYFQDAIEKNFFFDAKLCPERIFHAGNCTAAIVRCRPEFLDLVYNTWSCYNSRISKKSTLASLFIGTVNFELAARHNPETLLKFIPKKDANEIRKKILFRAGSG